MNGPGYLPSDAILLLTGLWAGDKGFEMNGAHQQTVTVLPKEDIVLAANAFADEYDYLALLRHAGLII